MDVFVAPSEAHPEAHVRQSTAELLRALSPDPAARHRLAGERSRTALTRLPWAKPSMESREDFGVDVEVEIKPGLRWRSFSSLPRARASEVPDQGSVVLPRSAEPATRAFRSIPGMPQAGARVSIAR